MLAHCANQSCCAPFKYLHEGRLFQFAWRGPAANLCDRIGFWWLCPACCKSMTLVPDAAGDVTLIPLRDAGNRSTPLFSAGAGADRGEFRCARNQPTDGSKLQCSENPRL